MVDAQTVSIVFAGLSIGLAAIYYMMTLRNSQKAQQLQLETRQAQLFMQIYYTWSSSETINIRKELRTWTWTDYDDFIQKYGEANNPEKAGEPLAIILSNKKIAIPMAKEAVENSYGESKVLYARLLGMCGEKVGN